ncbi:Tn3 family transposase post-transcriptional regulator TnpC [Chromobacterium haemolyticum]|uniref:Tn3 family transposase post-transcriptional regulator TnpC n=1 Tax=Chromobacterium haemolyticum TaxID=394935 RepID=UPI0005BE938F|nr:Tn3 family transposase post-transcriptional regulator TnpC [Chromobacterium haemolyticum]
MDLPKPTFAVTPYGDVDASQLKTLRASYDTTSLLALVDQLDRCCLRLVLVSGIRDDLLRLHGMVHTVINGAALTQPSGEMDLWEEAVGLTNEFRELAEVFLKAAEQIQPLADLNPHHKD